MKNKYDAQQAWNNRQAAGDALAKLEAAATSYEHNVAGDGVMAKIGHFFMHFGPSVIGKLVSSSERRGRLWRSKSAAKMAWTMTR